MKHGLGLGITLVFCGVVEAAEPPVRAPPAGSVPTPAPASAPAAAAAKPVVQTPTEPAKPLDLRVGDIRRYMMPRDYQATLRAPDADANTVVVEGQRELAPMRRVEDVPMGLGALWYSVKSPQNSWRMLAPVVGFKDEPPLDKVPPPIFRWGP